MVEIYAITVIWWEIVGIVYFRDKSKRADDSTVIIYTIVTLIPVLNTVLMILVLINSVYNVIKGNKY
jgi:hypothetical protein